MKLAKIYQLSMRLSRHFLRLRPDLRPSLLRCFTDFGSRGSGKDAQPLPGQLLRMHTLPCCLHLGICAVRKRQGAAAGPENARRPAMCRIVEPSITAKNPFVELYPGTLDLGAKDQAWDAR